jgi:hypothetical protein
LLLNAISHPAISKDLKKHIVEKVNDLSNRDLADYDLIDLNEYPQSSKLAKFTLSGQSLV